MRTSMTEIQNEIFCAKQHSNQQIVVMKLDNKLKPNQRLLCSQCIQEVEDAHFQSISFQKVTEKIQFEQDRLYQCFNEQTKKTIEHIQRFKQIINQLKNNINSKLDAVLGFGDGWINNLIQNRKQKHQYSLIKSLENFDQPIEQKFLEQIQEIYQINYSYYKKIEFSFLNNSYLQDFNRCQLVLQEVFDGNLVLDQQLLFSENFQKYGHNDTLEIQQKCSKHQSNFVLVDISEGIQKEDRLKCLYCDKGNSIPVQEFILRWQVYDTVKQGRMKKILMQRITKLKRVKEMLTQFMMAQYRQTNELINFIDNQLLFGERQHISSSIANFSLKDIIANKAEELCDFKEDRLTSDELLQQKKISIFQSTILQQFKKMSRSLQKTVSHAFVEFSDKITYELIDDKTYQSEYSRAITFNNDSTLMVTGCEKQIKVWSFQKGQVKQQLALLSGHTKEVWCLVFSKKVKWFASGSDDSTIRCWKDIGNNVWISSQPENVHTNSVRCILLNKNEDQLISCSRDNSIKIWRVDQEKNEMYFEYSLDKHTNSVYQITLNESEDHLASCSRDKKILIWGKNYNNKWEFKYSIAKSVDDYGYRISFLGDDAIAWQQYNSEFIHIFQLENGEFQEKPELRITLNPLKDSGTQLFPAIYNSKRQVLIQKHNKYVYILRKYLDCKLQIEVEPIDCFSDFNYGAFTENGSYLVIWNDKINQFLVYQVKYQ